MIGQSPTPPEYHTPSEPDSTAPTESWRYLCQEIDEHRSQEDSGSGVLYGAHGNTAQSASAGASAPRTELIDVAQLMAETGCDRVEIGDGRYSAKIEFYSEPSATARASKPVGQPLRTERCVNGCGRETGPQLFSHCCYRCSETDSKDHDLQCDVRAQAEKE